MLSEEQRKMKNRSFLYGGCIYIHLKKKNLFHKLVQPILVYKGKIQLYIFRHSHMDTYKNLKQIPILNKWIENLPVFFLPKIFRNILIWSYVF